MNYELNYLHPSQDGDGLFNSLDAHFAHGNGGKYRILADGCMIAWARQHPKLKMLVEDKIMVDVDTVKVHRKLSGTLPTSRHYYLEKAST